MPEFKISGPHNGGRREKSRDHLTAGYGRYHLLLTLWVLASSHLLLTLWVLRSWRLLLTLWVLGARMCS